MAPMTYGDDVPIPEAAPVAPPTGRHRADDPDASAVRLPVAVGGPIVTADGVVFRLPDPDRELAGVRLEVDWILGDIDPEFSWADGLWSLRIPRPDAWRLEYQLTLRRHGDTSWTSDPGNPRRVTPVHAPIAQNLPRSTPTISAEPANSSDLGSGLELSVNSRFKT